MTQPNSPGLGRHREWRRDDGLVRFAKGYALGNWFAGWVLAVVCAGLGYWLGLLFILNGVAGMCLYAHLYRRGLT